MSQLLVGILFMNLVIHTSVVPGSPPIAAYIYESGSSSFLCIRTQTFYLPGETCLTICWPRSMHGSCQDLLRSDIDHP